LRSLARNAHFKASAINAQSAKRVDGQKDRKGAVHERVGEHSPIHRLVSVIFFQEAGGSWDGYCSPAFRRLRALYSRLQPVLGRARTHHAP
jgi:hypothetical protein